MIQDLFNHWPFAAVSLVLATIGQVLKNTIWTKPKAAESVFHRIMRKTMPLHPVLVGGLLGLIPQLPGPEELEGTGARVLYFALAGVCSTWAYAVLRQLLKRQLGVTVDPARPSTLPPP